MSAGPGRAVSTSFSPIIPGVVLLHMLFHLRHLLLESVAGSEGGLEGGCLQGPGRAVSTSFSPIIPRASAPQRAPSSPSCVAGSEGWRREGVCRARKGSVYVIFAYHSRG